SGAAAGALGIAALALPAFQPAGHDPASAPDAATCAALREASAYEHFVEIYGTQRQPAVDIPNGQEAADRVTCYLLATLPRHFSPDAKFEPDPARPGTAALVARPEEDLTGDLTRYVTAS